MIQLEAIRAVDEELTKASNKFGAFKSPHEGLAIIQEEFEELKVEVFKQFGARDGNAMQEEAKQLAAMAVRFMVDLT